MPDMAPLYAGCKFKGNCALHLKPVLTPPHRGHLVAEAPGLESLKQATEFRRGGTHFLLVIDKSARQVIGKGVVILAHVGQHPQEALTIGPGGRGERALQRGQQQFTDQAAVHCDVAVTKTAPLELGQFGFEVCRQSAVSQRAAQLLYLMRRDQVQVSPPHYWHPRPRADLVSGTIFQNTAAPAFHRYATLAQQTAAAYYKAVPGLSSLPS